ncbi:MAG: S-layer homology domain-containing protein [Clostridiales Family XIII bacterium]|jgi:hypothetical protein|nr:S-layer homology domain-containing protein [Clostridiales Family XIII bacterium]
MKTKKYRGRLLVAALLIAAVTATVPPAVFGADYGDVRAGHWAYEAISAMSEDGVVAGFPDGGFKPAEQVTYGEFIKMAHLAAGGSDPGNSGDGHWAAGYYRAAVDAGYFTAYDISVRAMDYAISREYMALILSNVLGDTEIEAYDALRDGITDIDARTPHEYDIIKAYAAGLLTGYPDSSFRPAETLTRAEAVTVVYRLKNAEARLLPEPEAAPGELSALERFNTPRKGGGVEGFLGVAESSQSKKLLTDIIDTILIDNGVSREARDWDSFAAEFEPYEVMKYYEIMTDYPFQMQITHNLLGGEVLDIVSEDAMYIAKPYLVKGSTLTPLFDGGSHIYPPDDPTCTGTFPDFDYIAFKSVTCDTVILLPNTLQQNDF